MLKLAAAKGGDVQMLCDAVAGSATKFQQLVTWAERLALRGPKPAYGAPPQVAAHGFSGANMPHFLDHTWEYLDLTLRMNKKTTFWPQGTSPSQISQYLGEALDHLNPPGSSLPRLPQPTSVTSATTSGGGVQIGMLNDNRILQFFPTSGETILKAEMRAIGQLLGIWP
jgi:hypothetical protein